MSENTTVITENVFEQESKQVLDELDSENLSKTIMDLSIPLETRIEALDLYERSEKEEVIELINKLIMMYQLSGIKILREFLFAICEKSTINAFLKSISAKGLCTFNPSDELGYRAIDLVYPKLDDTIGTPYKIEFVKLLMRNETFKEQALTHFCDITNNQTIDCDYRYKTILSLTNEDTDLSYFSIKSCLQFVQNDRNRTLYRILGGQYLLQEYKQKETVREYIDRDIVENILLQFAEDNELDYNLRADATDVLLQLGSENKEARARELIMLLGRNGGRNVRTIYDNAQNVHSQGVEESVAQAIEFLHTFNIMKKDGDVITFEYVENEILEMIKEERKQKDIVENEKWDKEEKIIVSLNRIYMDRALYSVYSCRLEDVLLRVWTYLIGHEHEEDMKTRLLEELEEMSGTCSSGFITRLINTISGFGDFSIRISWREQIVANLSGRLNARARELDNLDIQEKILNEMTLETSEYNKRKNFLRFLRQNVLSIREELWSEFKEHIEDTDFDLYFRAAISMYETGNFL